MIGPIILGMEIRVVAEEREDHVESRCEDEAKVVMEEEEEEELAFTASSA